MKCIIARWNEDVTPLLNSFPDNFVVQKGKDLPNIGREPSSYLWYIIQNYDTLDGVYLFTQGNPEHTPEIFEYNYTDSFNWFIGQHGRLPKEMFKCDLEGKPQDNVDIKGFLNSINLEYNLDYIIFPACCTFSISAIDIKKNSKEYYEKIYEVLMNTNLRYEYAFERLIRHIFYKDQDILYKEPITSL